MDEPHKHNVSKRSVLDGSPGGPAV
ncbi:hypothetical protein VULLAG_LOCUS21167 [Vulpes lagopus]